jgi:hypothetical protein
VPAQHIQVLEDSLRLGDGFGKRIRQGCVIGFFRKEIPDIPEGTDNSAREDQNFSQDPKEKAEGGCNNVPESSEQFPHIFKRSSTFG